MSIIFKDMEKVLGMTNKKSVKFNIHKLSSIEFVILDWNLKLSKINRKEFQICCMIDPVV